MIIDDLWEKYRIRCCLPDDETSELICWQRRAFYAAVAATILVVTEDPEGCGELCASAFDWVHKEYAGAN